MRILVQATNEAKDNCLDFVKVDRGYYSHEELKVMDEIMKEKGYGAWKNGKGWNLYDTDRYNLKKIY